MLNNIVVRIREALLDKLLDQVSEEAKKSPRLRMNFAGRQVPPIFECGGAMDCGSYSSARGEG